MRLLAFFARSPSPVIWSRNAPSSRRDARIDAAEHPLRGDRRRPAFRGNAFDHEKHDENQGKREKTPRKYLRAHAMNPIGTAGIHLSCIPQVAAPRQTSYGATFRRAISQFLDRFNFDLGGQTVLRALRGAGRRLL